MSTDFYKHTLHLTTRESELGARSRVVRKRGERTNDHRVVELASCEVFRGFDVAVVDVNQHPKTMWMESHRFNAPPVTAP